MPRAARPVRSSDTPERILEAALEAFSQKGFEGARTRDIAARAKVTLGLLQYHFGTKDALWKAAVERAFEDLNEELAPVLQVQAPPKRARGSARESARNSAVLEREQLGRMIRAHVRFVAKNAEFIRIMHDEGKQRSPRMRWLADRYTKPLLDRVSPIIQRAQKSGILLSNIDPAHFFYALVGAAGMIFHQAEECKRATGIDPCAPSAVEAHCRTVESMFLGHVQPHQEKTS